MSFIKFYVAGNYNNYQKLNDFLSCDTITAERFKCADADLFVAHRNRYTTIIKFDADKFKEHYKFNRKTNRYDQLKGYHISPMGRGTFTANFVYVSVIDHNA